MMPYRTSPVRNTSRGISCCLSTQIDSDSYEKFDRLAKRADKSKSELLRDLVGHLIANPDMRDWYAQRKADEGRP